MRIIIEIAFFKTQVCWTSKAKFVSRLKFYQYYHKDMYLLGFCQHHK